jgi:hypothetical protein
MIPIRWLLLWLFLLTTSPCLAKPSALGGIRSVLPYPAHAILDTVETLVMLMPGCPRPDGTGCAAIHVTAGPMTLPWTSTVWPADIRRRWAEPR